MSTPQRFAYYERLSRADRRIYDRSDAVDDVALPDLAPLQAAAQEIEAGLAAADRKAVTRASNALATLICEQLGVQRPFVRVLSKRPKDEHEELHGLYVREEGEPAVIRVWMRTAERRDVVRFRTFTRTLLHEVLHHLDYEWLGLADSFHTGGFYRREARLTAALCGPAQPRSEAQPRGEAQPRAEARRRGEASQGPGRGRRARQLDLFGAGAGPAESPDERGDG